MPSNKAEFCAICACPLHRGKGDYARDNVRGRAHATRHHYVPERFFGRSSNRKGTQRQGIFDTCPWGHERKVVVFCYECHEELIHNPVILPDDIELFSRLVALRGHSEQAKPDDRQRIAARVRLLQEVISRGVRSVLEDEDGQALKAEGNLT